MTLVAFLLNRWAQLGAAIVVCLALGFCEGKKYADRSAEVRGLNTKVAALEWAARANAEASRKIDEAAKREIANRQAAEARAAEEMQDADEWEKRYNEANDALGKVKCEPLSVQPDAPPPVVRCPDPFYSDDELRRLKAKYPAKARPPADSR